MDLFKSIEKGILVMYFTFNLFKYNFDDIMHFKDCLIYSNTQTTRKYIKS